MNLKRDDVVAALRAEDVAAHLGITGQWRGRWMHARRCGETDHGSDAFAISRDGKWHCHSCDKGGDLLLLLALGTGIDIKQDFPAVLALGATIAGLDTGVEFGAPTRPAPVDRPPVAPLPPLPERIALARRRAVWVWDRLYNDVDSVTDAYLRSRGVDPAAVRRREDVRTTPIKIPRPDQSASDELKALWWTMGSRRGALSIVVPVRSVDDGRPVDLRARRIEPEEGQPKIIGMVGGVTSAPAERGKTRQLIGCYGNPHAIDSDLVIIVEGLMDYLTALYVWPNAQVLGAVEAGSLGLVTGHAARMLAARDSTSRLLIVEQADPPRRNKATGAIMPGAADASINEDPNAATKVSVRHLGPHRVGWLFCDGADVKDLNDLVQAKADVHGTVTWWT
jgi:hypothetical protein